MRSNAFPQNDDSDLETNLMVTVITAIIVLLFVHFAKALLLSTPEGSHGLQQEESQPTLLQEPNTMPEYEQAVVAPATWQPQGQQVALDNVSIYLLTYNLNQQNPSGDLTGLFDFQVVGAHDIYVIALEELTYMSMLSWDPYMNAFDNIFRNRGYVRLTRHRYMLTSVTIYVPKNKISEFYEVKVLSVTTDIAMRKGGIVIRLHYRGISFAFIGAHLAAHDEYYEKRLKDYREIIQGAMFSDQGKDGVLDQDYAFFLGDLNFRINSLTSQQVYDAILIAESKPQNDTTKWNGLLRYDQLNKARAEKTAFSEFDESAITFAPTFKFIVGTDNYHWQKRKPGFTDRILYRNTLINRVVEAAERDAVQLRISHYDSLPQFMGSDHKPVRAVVHISEDAFEVKQRLLHGVVQRTKRTNERAQMQTVTNRARTTAAGSDGTEQYVYADGYGYGGGGGGGYTRPSRAHRYQRDRTQGDPSLSLARYLRVVFEPITNWTLENNQTVLFRVVDTRTNHSVGSDFPGLFQVLSNWDWIGLYREDFYSLDQYITFAYPRFGNTIEEAEDALALLRTESDESDSGHDIPDGAAPDVRASMGFFSTESSPALSSSSSPNKSTSSIYLSSTEFGDHEVSVAQLTIETTTSASEPGAPSAEAHLPPLKEEVLEEEEKSSSSSSKSSSSHSSSKTSSSYLSKYEDEPDGNEVAKFPKPTSSSSATSLSGSGDQTSGSSSSSSSSSPTSSSSSSSRPSSSSATTTTPSRSTSTSSPTQSRHTSPSPPPNVEQFTAIFDENNYLVSPGRYVLIYRRKNGDVLGMSEAFEISSNTGSELASEAEEDFNQQPQPPQGPHRQA